MHCDLFLGLFLAGCKKWINRVCLCLCLDVQIDFKCDTHVWTSLQHGTNATFTHKQMNGQMNEHVEHRMELQNSFCLGSCLAGCQKWSHCVWVCFHLGVQMELRCETHVNTSLQHGTKTALMAPGGACADQCIFCPFTLVMSLDEMNAASHFHPTSQITHAEHEHTQNTHKQNTKHTLKAHTKHKAHDTKQEQSHRWMVRCQAVLAWW